MRFRRFIEGASILIALPARCCRLVFEAQPQTLRLEAAYGEHRTGVVEGFMPKTVPYYQRYPNLFKPIASNMSALFSTLDPHPVASRRDAFFR